MIAIDVETNSGMNTPTWDCTRFILKMQFKKYAK